MMKSNNGFWIQIQLALGAFIENFMVVYFDDILAYNSDFQAHVDGLRPVFDTLCNNKFYANRKKCNLVDDVLFLG